jgi:hypothetical protein
MSLRLNRLDHHNNPPGHNTLNLTSDDETGARGEKVELSVLGVVVV